MTMWRSAGAAMLLGLAVLPSAQSSAAEKFQKLNGSQIRAKFTGMEMTDGTHWADVFLTGGALTTYSMSRKTSGKWEVQKDELCVDRGKTTGAATRCGFRARTSSSGAKARPCHWKGYCRGRQPELMAMYLCMDFSR
jgi:hypothetical protein